jgi:hypothetical protein
VPDSKSALQLAAVMSEVMNLADLVRRGDDAAWSGIGSDAHLRVASELMQFAELAAQEETLREARGCAQTLAEELMRTGVPVSVRAQDLASALLTSMGVGTELLSALDGRA